MVMRRERGNIGYYRKCEYECNLYVLEGHMLTFYGTYSTAYFFQDGASCLRKNREKATLKQYMYVQLLSGQISIQLKIFGMTCVLWA